MTIKREFVRGDGVLHAQLKPLGAGRFSFSIEGRTQEVSAMRLPGGSIRFTLDGKTHVADSAPCGKQMQVRLDGLTHVLEPAQARSRSGGDAGTGKVVEAPMTGTVTRVLVSRGQQVEKGQTLVVLTAMKMEHKLNAGFAGKVIELNVTEGATVDSGAVLVRLE